MDFVLQAQRIADEVLFPAAIDTDGRDAVPRELLDTLAAAGLYGLAAPPEAGGLGADLLAACAVHEALASGCLTTAFVWAQHHGLVRSLAAGGNPELAASLLPPLARGEVRAGVALAGALPKPTLRATPGPGGWRLDGVSPFVSGWGRIDVLHVAARAGDEIVWLLVDAAEGTRVRTERLELAALNATVTVRATFDGLPVAAGRMTARHPVSEGTAPEVLRIHAAFALGVAARCCRMLGPTPLDEELAALRAELDRLGPGTAAARGAAGELALRAAAALMTAQGSRSLLATEHGQRLAREAMFVLVYALRPASRAALLPRLGAAASG
ncbi:MAG TPA: acyl-CoA dehydrogenase family protein [Streptosporangiaceae bacterium]|nr:acyl-CoA dehydrogenase family protein [Streptosporangiaceae bacterium]